MAEVRKGYVLLAKTEGDTTAPPDKIDEMADLLRERGNDVEVLGNKIVVDSMLQKGLTDPHLAHPIKNPSLQGVIIEKLFL